MGFEVIFVNFLLADEVVRIALQEDAQVVGISSSSGGHLVVLEDLMAGLHREQMDDVLVIAGGIIPGPDARQLEKLGVAGVFGPGSSPKDVARFIEDHLALIRS